MFVSPYVQTWSLLSESNTHNRLRSAKSLSIERRRQKLVPEVGLGPTISFERRGLNALRMHSATRVYKMWRGFQPRRICALPNQGPRAYPLLEELPPVGCR